MSNEDITKLLVDWNQGNEAARDELIPLVANELRRIASRYAIIEKQAIQ